MTNLNPAINGHETLTGPASPVGALAEFYAAFNGRDLDRMRANWSAATGISMSNPLGGILRGWDEIGALYGRIFTGPARVTVEFHDYTLHEAGGMFLAVGRERGEYRRDGLAITLAIRTSRTFRWEGGRWRQLHHHGPIDHPALLQTYQTAVRGGAVPANA